VSAAKRYAKRICKSQIACDGNAVGLGFEDCHRCREKQKLKSKPPKQLRGEHCANTYSGRL